MHIPVKCNTLISLVAVYLCKRTMQNKARLELSDFEAENLARLQKMFSRKWEFIFMQAEAQSRVDKKRDKLERKVLDSQERAFWDVHRPVVSGVKYIHCLLVFTLHTTLPIKWYLTSWALLLSLVWHHCSNIQLHKIEKCIYSKIEGPLVHHEIKFLLHTFFKHTICNAMHALHFSLDLITIGLLNKNYF